MKRFVDTTTMGSYDSGINDSIPAVVNEEQLDSTFMLVNQLKTISYGIGHIKESLAANDDLHHQVNFLTEAVDHLTRQTNAIRQSNRDIQTTLKTITRDIKSLKDNRTSAHKVQDHDQNSTNGGSLQRSNIGKGKRPKKPWAQAVHIEEALQENFMLFINELSFSSTQLPDKLFESNCLSDDECAVIRSKSEKDQVRHLVYKLMIRGPDKIFAFLEHLRETGYDKLANAVYRSLERIACEQKDVKMNCLVCHLKDSVDLRDICDHLFHAKMIKRDTYGAIIEPITLYENRKLIWSEIINDINRAKNVDESMGYLIEAVKGKYDHLTRSLSESQSEGLQCVCGLKRRRRQRKALNSDTGSQTDMSTTSEIPLFSALNSNYAHSEADSTSAISSLDLGISFANLNPYLQHRDRMVPCDSTTQDIDAPEASECVQRRCRHGSGKFNVTPGQAENTTQEYRHQQSMEYIGSRSPDSTIRPPFEKSISHLSTGTVRPASSTDSGDVPYQTDGSDGKTSSGYKTDHRVDFETTDSSLNANTPTSTEAERKPFNPKETPLNIVTTSKKRGKTKMTPRLRNNLELLGGEENEFADGEDDEALPRKHTTSKQRVKIKQRNGVAAVRKLSIPAASATASDRRFHMKKKTRQRKERRERNLVKHDYDANFDQSCRAKSHNPRLRKVPYNPTWQTHAQRPRTIHWDYNQARRHWRVSHLMADALRKEDSLDPDQSWTEGSDTHA